MLSTGSSVKGSIRALSGSGINSMSEASMLFHPAIEEPSKKCPLSNLSMVKALTGTDTCCSLPRVSVKRKSTNLTSFSLIIFMTSLADIAIAGSPQFSDFRLVRKGIKRWIDGISADSMPCSAKKAGHCAISKDREGERTKSARTRKYLHYASAEQVTIPCGGELNYHVSMHRVHTGVLCQRNPQMKS